VPRDELAEVRRERTGGGVGTVQERLGRNGTTAMAFLEAFETSQKAPRPSSPAGNNGVERQSFGEGGLWRRHTSSAVFTSTSTRTTSEEHLVRALEVRSGNIFSGCTARGARATAGEGPPLSLLPLLCWRQLAPACCHVFYAICSLWIQECGTGLPLSVLTLPCLSLPFVGRTFPQ
jgi:hypothetical protein